MRSGEASWWRASALQWTIACGLACAVIISAVTSEEAWAYLSAPSANSGVGNFGGAPSASSTLAEVETAQVRAAHVGGGCGDGGHAAPCRWAYRRADDVVAAPRRAACHKTKRSFTDRPRAAGILAMALHPPRTSDALEEVDAVVDVAAAFVAAWRAADVGEEVIVVLTVAGSIPEGGAEDDTAGDDDKHDDGRSMIKRASPAVSPAAHRAGLLDRLMAEVLTGENHHLVYAPSPLTPSQALDRGLRLAVSPVAVLSVGGVGGEGGGCVKGECFSGGCFKALAATLRRHPHVAVVASTGEAETEGDSSGERDAEGRTGGPESEEGPGSDEEEAEKERRRLSLATSALTPLRNGKTFFGGGPVAVRRGAVMGLGLYEGCGGGDGGGIEAAAVQWRDGGGTSEWVRAAAEAGAATAAARAPCPAARTGLGLRAVGGTLDGCPGRKSGATPGILAMGEKMEGKKKAKVVGKGTAPAAEDVPEAKEACSGCCGDNLTAAYGVNFFRRPELFKHLPRALVTSGGGDLDEVLVNDDSLDAAGPWLAAVDALGSGKGGGGRKAPAGGSTRRTLRYALMRSHDLHEVRGMNRLVAYSDADVVVLAQDDDLPPAAADDGDDSSSPRGRWLAEIRSLFCRHPRLALIGGKRGFKPHPSPGRFMSKPLKSFGYGWWKNMRTLPTRPIQYHDPSLNLPFMFVAVVNMGPLVVRRSAFLSVGMFHEATSCVGEPGIQFDAEIGLRLWEHGWQVGLYESGFRLGYEDGNDFGGEGTHGGSQWKIREDNDRFNQRLMWDMYGERLRAIGSKVSKANKGLEARPSTNRY